MPDGLIIYCILNGIIVFAHSFYLSYKNDNNKKKNDEELEYLRNKICNLEKHVLILEQNLDNLHQK